MHNNLPRVSRVRPQLGIIEGLDISSFDELQINLVEERKKRKEQAETEEYWAGRSLATRNSTRRAA